MAKLVTFVALSALASLVALAGCGSDTAATTAPGADSGSPADGGGTGDTGNGGGDSSAPDGNPPPGPDGGCSGGRTNCGGICVDTTNDPNHCGSCTKTCTAPANGTGTCTASQCGVTCNPGYSTCSSGCCTKATAVAAANHTCALLTGGAVECWGHDQYGELGNGGPLTDSTTPVAVIGITGATAISLGQDHSCALMGDGSVMCWGDNQHGELGDGTTVQRNAPTGVMGLSGVTLLGIGWQHSCAATAGGVQCWGFDSYGQIGDGMTVMTPVMMPVAVSNLTAASNLAGGSLHTCAVASGGAQCWGFNAEGQLGNGAGMPDSNTPVNVQGLASGVTAVTGGQYFSCAIVNGGVKCWGGNAGGQLGDGTMNPSPIPVDVTGLSGITAISAGVDHMCALTTGGGVKCWGNNAQGEVGDGTLGNVRTGPVDVMGLTSGVVSVACGEAHSCAVTSAGAVMCWGANNFGQLGNGMMAMSGMPVEVSGL